MDPLTQVLNKHLPEKSWRKMITHQILSLNNGSKFGFLFDCGAIAASRLTELIKDINRVGLLQSDLVVVSIGVDLIILNLNRFLGQDSKPILINISGSLEAPEILKDESSVLSMFKAIDNQLQDFSNYFNDDNLLLDLQLEPTYCIPTIFGYLIGYPVIYWFDVASDDNCLGNVDLKVYQIYFHDQLIISFSIPNNLLVDTLIMQNLVKWDSFIQTFNITSKDFLANYPVVIL